MQGDDPPFLPVGTDVSAKYKGAFCEAKIKKVVRNIKCKVTLKAGGITTVNDDVIKGTLRVGSTVEVKQDPKKEAMEAVITKIQDCSQYTVVFDDGDITTLRRSALCLKSGRHFNESETLDQLPLTHPEHFSTPVIAGRRGRRGRAQSDDSEGEGSGRRLKESSAEREPHVGRVVLVEAAGGAERRRPHQPAFPALVVVPTAQIKVKEDYLVRSFKDGRYYTVPKKEAREFRKGSAPQEWAGVEAALQYLNHGVLPPHWDRDSLFNEHESRNISDCDSSDDEPREEKDHFVAQLYKFMDDRGTPLNRNPTIANRDIDLYRLFRVVQKLGGYNRVTNQNQWKAIADKMGFHPVTTSITNLCKQAYKKFLHSFEDFYRKLGVTLVAHPRGARTPPAGRSLIRDRDKLPPASGAPGPSASPAPSAAPAGGPAQRSKDKESDKSETEKSEKEDKIEKVEKKSKIRASDEDDSADNQPLITTTPKIDKEKEKEKEKEREKERDKDKIASTSEEKGVIKPRSQSKTRSLPPVKMESHDKRTPKRKTLSSKVSEGSSSMGRSSRRPNVSTDSDSSGRASRCGLSKKMQSRRSQSANSASSGNTIASNSSKRPRKRKTTEPSMNESTRSGGSNVKAQVGDKLKVYYGPTQSESKVTYEAKVIEVSPEGMLRVHYTGWNTRYDEWIKPQRIALNVTQHESRNKKMATLNRRARSKRTEESSARSDTYSDSDSDESVKRPSKKSDDKSNTSKTSSRSKDQKSSDSSSSSKPRKRPVRTVSTPHAASPPKKPRSSIASHQHQGRDYDLNEIRSELKGLHSVKQEADESIKPEITKEGIMNPALNTTQPAEPSRQEKQPEDVYEFKEPEPFELELHDEKKKRTHRIFDDISPSKYASTLAKSLSEEISEDPLRPRPSSFRSPSLSPFRDFGTTRDVSGRQSPEDDSKDGLFSLDDDSLPGESSSGPIFEGFTPAKNQETYSKKSKVTKLRQLIDDSPDSPADDEQSSDDEPEEVIKQEKRDPSPILQNIEKEKSSESITEETKTPEVSKEITDAITLLKEIPEVLSIPEPPTTPPPKMKSDILAVKPSTSTAMKEIDVKKEENINRDDKIVQNETEAKAIKEKIMSIPLPSTEPKEKEPSKIKIEKLDPAPEMSISKMEPPSSPLIDTEEDKSEPDSPARIDVLPEPPPAFLLQSEGPKIAEKLLKAINSAKSLSMSPPRVENPVDMPKKDIKIEEKCPPMTIETKRPPSKPELLKPLTKLDPVKRMSPAEITESIFGEPSSVTDIKRDIPENKKAKPKEQTPPRLQSPLNILERRKSVADLPLSAPGKNKVLSDTIQKLSSQINQSVVAATIPLPSFPPDDRSESSDSDDSDRRLIIDKLAVDEWGSGSGNSGGSSNSNSVAVITGRTQTAAARALHAGKSPGEWSAGESLLMLEDACKNERKHSASVVVAGGARVSGGGAAEDESCVSLLLCEETIPGSPAPDAEPAPPARAVHLPFACAPQHAPHAPPAPPAPLGQHAQHGQHGQHGQHAQHGHDNHKPEERRGAAGEAGASGAEGAQEWARLDNTPPTTSDSSPDLSPHRERRISERDSLSDRKGDEEDSRAQNASHDIEKPHGSARSRKTSESSGVGRTRSRRARRDTDEPAHHAHHAHHPHHHAHHAHHAQPAQPAQQPDKYNFLLDLDPSWDSLTRINILTAQMTDLRKAYHSMKAELAVIDRRRKKIRRKEREAIKAAKAACS